MLKLTSMMDFSPLFLLNNIEVAQEALFKAIDFDGLKKAVDFTIKAHDGQKRKDGSDYVTHPIIVACIVAQLTNDKAMVLAALLHDVIEDTPHIIKDIEKLFGTVVAHLVDGLTKIDQISHQEKNSQKQHIQNEEKILKDILSFRKMLLNSIEDVRILIVKLCDRVHNIQSLDVFHKTKQKRIAKETLLVYVPIAHRLGISVIRRELEEQCFKYLYEKNFPKITHFYQTQLSCVQEQAAFHLSCIEKVLLQNGFLSSDFHCETYIRSAYGIFQRFQKHNYNDIDEILDLIAIKVITKEKFDCYRILGIIHAHFKPLTFKFKDYIALSKENGYQTLHTTILNKAEVFEVQISSESMHQISELGLCAKYKFNLKNHNIKLEWIKGLQKQKTKALEFYEFARSELFSENINVYSSKGELFTLPKGSLAIDFAYLIHSEIGNKATACVINKKRTSLLTPLKNGDIVIVEKGVDSPAQPSWIKYVKTHRAKVELRKKFSKKQGVINNYIAQNILYGFFHGATEQILENFNIDKRQKNRVANDLNELSKILKMYRQKLSFVNLSRYGRRYKYKIYSVANLHFYSNGFIKDVAFDYCCFPKKGDEIVAFKNDSIAEVHQKYCSNAFFKMQQHHPMFFCTWQDDLSQKYELLLNLKTQNKQLQKITIALENKRCNILSLDTKDGIDSHKAVFLRIESAGTNKEEIQKILASLAKVIQIKHIKENV